MPGTLLVRTTIPVLDPTSDPSSSSFVFATTGTVNPSSLGPLIAHVQKFWTTAGTGGTNAVQHYLSPVVDPSVNHATTEIYNITAHLDGSAHGSPITMTDFTITPSAFNSLPEGVAATVSFRADYGTDVEFGPGTRPRSRDRNRVYIGPLANVSTENDPTSFRCRFKAQFITDCLAALFDLSSSVTDDTGNEWVLQVWSRKNAATKLPTTGWMDDRPDYQRRRSDPNPGSRVSRALSSV